MERAFQKKSLIELKTDINFDDFEEIICYCRGDIYKTIKVKKFFQKIEKKIDLFERVALLIKFQSKKNVDPSDKFMEESNSIPRACHQLQRLTCRGIICCRSMAIAMLIKLLRLANKSLPGS